MVPVYDLLDAGPRHRFTVIGSKTFIVSNCQSTGHDCFIKFLLKTIRVLTDEGIECHPWSADVHDALYIEVPETEADRVCSLIKGKILDEWNKELGGTIALRAEPAVITNLWLDKSEGDELESAKEFAIEQRIRIGEKLG